MSPIRASFLVHKYAKQCFGFSYIFDKAPIFTVKLPYDHNGCKDHVFLVVLGIWEACQSTPFNFIFCSVLDNCLSNYIVISYCVFVLFVPFMLPFSELNIPIYLSIETPHISAYIIDVNLTKINTHVLMKICMCK